VDEYGTVTETTPTGFLVDEDDVQAHGIPEDTVTERVTIDRSSGCALLQQRVLRFAPGKSRERCDPDRHVLLFVASGSGRLHLGGDVHAVERDAGVFIAAGERWSIDNQADEELVAVAASAPADRPADVERRQVVVRFEDQRSLPATPNREFRYLVNEEAGCLDVTQFVGLIPPGRPGMHSHTYDEILYVIEGEGVLHMNGASRPIRAGSCMHLPPLREHAVENTGDGTMRVLGVFHPSGDPASRAYEET
jgi:mannose-6-phosphate isomerase-like protein (cupin superfamily)